MKILLGDCRELLKELLTDSVDSVVTDPPYELGFMGKSWDSTGIAFQPKLWAEVLRVLKPGGHLLSFGGSRTYHRMAVAIEDAGFEIRDQIMWIYGSGFPKSHNISKGIDKASDVPVKVGKAFKVAGEYGNRDLRDPEAQGLSRDEMRHTATTAEAKQWDGWGTALKPAHEPIVLARKPLIGTVANNVLAHGTGGLNIDASRVVIAPGDEPSAGHRTATFGNQDTQSGGNGSGGWTASSGRWPANVIHDGSNEVIELFPNVKSGGKNTTDIANDDGLFGFGGQPENNTAPSSGSAARFFYCAKANKRDRNEGCEELTDKEWRDEGAAIPQRENRPFLPSKNHHPTVKPTELMRYLCRLITPPKGIVLDPFMGSGSTGKAAVLEGFDFIGMEQSEEYITIANARIEFAKSKEIKEEGLW